MTGGARPFAGSHIYPERTEAPETAADRFLAYFASRFHNAFARALPEPGLLASEVARHAARFRGRPLAPHLPDLRYRLRRGGFGPELLSECLGLYCAALSTGNAQPPLPQTLGAARQLLLGGLVELADARDRLHALGLAAAAKAIHGDPVHLLTGNDVRARWAADALRAPCAALGIDVGCVGQGMDGRARREAYARMIVCAGYREVALDYLRDRIQRGGRSRGLVGTLERVAGYAPAGDRLLLPGLHCALVEDAEAVMLDDAAMPLLISGEADLSRERLIYEQALELARALRRDEDYALGTEGARLTEGGAESLARLVAPLGGIWAARQRREELITRALEALHLFEPGVDYHVGEGRVSLPEPHPGASDEERAANDVLRKLIEVKEGCRLSARREILARISVPGFLRRYLHLAGVCTDARGLEREFWALYSLKVRRAGPYPASLKFAARLFAGAEARHAALGKAVRNALSEGQAVLVAVRTPREAQVVSKVLDEAGVRSEVLRGGESESEQRALGALDSPGSAAVTLYPAERGVNRAGAKGAPLHLVVAEPHDAWRHIDRIYRAYGANSCEMLLSLEDEAVASALAAVPASAVQWGSGPDDELPPRRSRWLASLVMRDVERRQALLRGEVMARERYLGDLLAFSGQGD